MPFPPALRDLGPRRLTLAALIVLVGGWLTYGAAVHAASWLTQARAPSASLSLDSENAVALVRAADLKIVQNEGRIDGPELLQTGRAALRSAPLTAGGLRLIALAKQTAGRIDQATRLLELGSRVSRRDLGSQLMLIEFAVQRQDIAGALRHYDIALRTNRSAENLLFPILTATLDDPSIRSGLRETIRPGPPWVGSFLTHALRAGGQSRNVAALMAGADGNWPPARRRTVRDALLAGLAADRAFVDLAQSYRRTPGSNPAVLTDASFAATTSGTPEAVAWRPTTSPQISATFEQSNQPGRAPNLRVSVEPGASLIAARKLLMLPPGNYRLSGTLDADNWPAGAEARWVLKCALTPDEPTIWSGAFTGQGTPRNAAGTFATDARCPAQYLDLVVAAPAGLDAPELTVHSPALSVGGAAR